ncbi:ribonuclease HI [Chamaesiphon sp. VAR_48_metabat_135_sub]|uniref:ribonuclease HI n=1 Tax=Chamaesiphon sp. VAR_48_metabat_135_sub TaxID=2964699 RepID=UPI00286CFDA5|nr:ribonuclease HI [Chamaesiphon sp. VAR_48_metabat_135_sub]
MTRITNLYTDGACSGNPGPGGWATVAYFDDGSCHELGGRDGATTNNRMEMQAAISALEFFVSTKQTQQCILYTDSEYLIKGITQWVKGWKKKDWKTAAGKPVLNQDLWETLDRLDRQVQSQTKVPVAWTHVRGHSGNVGNERCDTIARGFSSGQPPQLRQHSTIEASEPSPVQHLPTRLVPIPSPPDLQIVPMIEEQTIHPDSNEHIPREVRVAHLHHLIDTLRIADEIAKGSYLIASSELADLMDINASAVTSRGDRWAWRNWIVSRVRREGNQILWQLERVDD